MIIPLRGVETTYGDDTPIQLIGVGEDGFWVCGCDGDREAQARLRYIMRGGARDHFPVPGAYVAEIGFDGVERRRFQNRIATWVLDGVAVFRHWGSEFEACAYRLEDEERIWAYPRDVVYLWRNRVLGYEPASVGPSAGGAGLSLRSTQTGDVELALPMHPVFGVAQNRDWLVILEEDRLFVYALADKRKRSEIALGEDRPDRLYGRQLAMAEGCVWFVRSAPLEEDTAIVGFDLETGALAARHLAQADEFGSPTTCAHARWGAIFVQQRRVVQVTRAELVTRSRGSTFGRESSIHATQDVLFASTSPHGGTLFTPTHAYACGFAFAPRRFLFGRRHVVIEWSDYRFGVVAIDELIRASDAGEAKTSPRFAPDARWYSAEPARQEHYEDPDADALADLLIETGLLELDDSSRRRVLESALSSVDATEPGAARELLMDRSTHRFFYRYPGDGTDIFEEVNAGLEDEPWRFERTSDEDDSYVDFRLRPHPPPDESEEDEDDDDDALRQTFRAHDDPLTYLVEYMNSMLECVGAKRRIYRFDGEIDAFAVLPGEDAAKLTDRGVGLEPLES